MIVHDRRCPQPHPLSPLEPSLAARFSRFKGLFVDESIRLSIAGRRKTRAEVPRKDKASPRASPRNSTRAPSRRRVPNLNQRGSSEAAGVASGIHRSHRDDPQEIPFRETLGPETQGESEPPGFSECRRAAQRVLRLSIQRFSTLP